MIRQLFRSPLALAASLLAALPFKKAKPAPVPVPQVPQEVPPPSRASAKPRPAPKTAPEFAYVPSQSARNQRRKERQAARAFVRALNQGRG